MSGFPTMCRLCVRQSENGHDKNRLALRKWEEASLKCGFHGHPATDKNKLKAFPLALANEAVGD